MRMVCSKGGTLAKYESEDERWNEISTWVIVAGAGVNKRIGRDGRCRKTIGGKKKLARHTISVILLLLFFFFFFFGVSW